MCSLKRRINKIDGFIDAIRSGEYNYEDSIEKQKKLEIIVDPLDEKTADEEELLYGEEENEVAENQLLEGVIASSLADLQVERNKVQRLFNLARQVSEQGQESKFERLIQIIRDPKFREEKAIIFTEHRDTLSFLVHRLEGIGYSGQVAQIHGGMGTKPNPRNGLSERDEQVEFFRKSAKEGGARFLVATDAAGEGINLQFCWLMINYDIPWNPARLEQRMGRIHRYKQKHDPVVIINLIAGDTREGRVLKILLEKLERIRQELNSDKVFDVVGRLFQDVSIKYYMNRLLTEEDESEVARELDGKLTNEQVQAIEARDKMLYGGGGDVMSQLPRLQDNMSRETYQRLLPGYVHRFIETSAPQMDFAIEGNLNEIFSIRPLKAGALDQFWPVLEMYPAEHQNRLTIHRPDSENTIFLHPGEPFFDYLRDIIRARFGVKAKQGGVFIDPSAIDPYLFHLALVEVVRQADENIPSLNSAECLDYRLIGLKQESNGNLTEIPVEWLLLLQGGDGQANRAIYLVARARELRDSAYKYISQTLSQYLVDEHQKVILDTLPERLEFLQLGYTYQENELASMRTRYREKAKQGDSRAKAELTKIKDRQQKLHIQRDFAIKALQLEPDLISAGEITFITHALVLPSAEPQDIQRRDEAIEAIAMQMTTSYEKAMGATVLDVSTPSLARTAGLSDWPGFDLLSRYPNGEERAIEVKGRAQSGDVMISENEWAKACNLRDRYWLYVVFNCASSTPQLFRISDPWGVLIASIQGYVLDKQAILLAANNNSEE